MNFVAVGAGQRVATPLNELGASGYAVAKLYAGLTSTRLLIENGYGNHQKPSGGYKSGELRIPESLTLNARLTDCEYIQSAIRIIPIDHAPDAAAIT